MKQNQHKGQMQAKEIQQKELNSTKNTSNRKDNFIELYKTAPTTSRYTIPKDRLHLYRCDEVSKIINPIMNNNIPISTYYSFPLSFSKHSNLS